MSNTPPSAVALEVVSGYSKKKIPLGAFTALVAANALLTGSLMAAESRRPTRLSTFGAGDILLLGIATHKLSRLIAKDRVTSPFRAPFARLVKSAGAGEVEEEARGEGMQKAIGQLVTCPYCVSPWVAAALAAGVAVAPRATRVFCCILAAVGISHFLNHAYVAVEELHS